MIGRFIAGALVVAAALGAAAEARADAAPANLFAATESADPPAGPATAPRARIMPFGPAPAPRVVLCPPMRVTRPSDIPPPKPTKGLALAFEW